MFYREEYEKRVEWYRQARFGMFIHWGLYAIPARGEWVRSVEEIPEEEYMPFFEEFNPVDFEPEKWAKAAKEAGMKYAVMTAKHHDGFCLFDSELTDFKSTNTKAGKDLVREYLDAFRKEGLKVGMFRPVTLWPFPEKELQEATKNAKKVLTVEMSMGQMIDDVKLAINCSKPVEFFGRTGGIIPAPADILNKIKEMGGNK